MLEETGVDIASGDIDLVNTATGEHEKTLRDTGERVFAQMTFYDYRIRIPQNADDIEVKAEDDWSEPAWFSADEIRSERLSPPTKRTLQKIGFL